MDETATYTPYEQITVESPARRRRQPHKLIIASLLVTGLAVGGVAFAQGSQPSNASATADSSPLTTALAANMASNTSGTAGSFEFRGRFGRGGFSGIGRVAGGLTVSTVSGTTITATGRAGQTITITVTGATKYTKAGQSIALTDIQKGDKIAVQGTRTSTTAITATSVEVVLPVEAGVVTAVNGTDVTITSFGSTSHVIHLGTSTTYTRAGHTATSGDVVNGTSIVAEGTANIDGSLNALRVTIETAHVAGQVSALGNGTYTISNMRGSSSVIVNTNTSTIYQDAQGNTVQPSTITTGTLIMAEGTLSQDGKSMAALRITVLSANANGMGHGRFGRGFGGGSVAPAATATTPATTSNSGV